MNRPQKNCLVTGAAGFIGSHLSELLIEEGHRVIGVDNLKNGRKQNLKLIWDHSRFHFSELNINNQEKLNSALSDVDWGFHLAARADIVPSIKRPEKFHESNVNGTLSVLEAARNADVDRFIYAASSSCYGIPDNYPTPETAEIRPQYPYALTKYLGEKYVMHWEQVYDLPSVSLRLFNVFGPRHYTDGAYGAVFGVFLAQKLAGEPYTVVGDGTQTRDFTYVTDVARAFLSAAKSDRTGEIYNVGSGGTYSINRLVELLGGEKVHIPERPGEPDCTYADITKIERELGWEPHVNFEQGINRLLDHIDEFKTAPVWDEQSIENATEEWFEHLGEETEVPR